MKCQRCRTQLLPGERYCPRCDFDQETDDWLWDIQGRPPAPKHSADDEGWSEGTSTFVRRLDEERMQELSS